MGGSQDPPEDGTGPSKDDKTPSDSKPVALDGSRIGSQSQKPTKVALTEVSESLLNRRQRSYRLVSKRLCGGWCSLCCRADERGFMLRNI